MFDIGASELLIIAVVAILVIGPKDMPLALRTAGRWIGQIRKVSAHFRAGIDAMVREAELEEMEKKWQERNAQIMRDHPGEMTELPPAPPADSAHDPQADDRLSEAEAPGPAARPGRTPPGWRGLSMGILRDIDETQAPLMEHLVELRTRLLRSVFVLAIAFGVCFYFADQILAFLARPLAEAFPPGQGRLVYTKLYEVFFVEMKVGLFGAFCVSFPFIANQLWAFVAPGLYAKEKKALLPFLIATPIFFIAGASLAYFVVMPTAFRFFLGFQGSAGGLPIEALPSAGEYLSLVMQFILAFGISFLLPVLLLLLERAGLVQRATLAKARAYVVVGVLALAAVATPPDPGSQLILAIPLYLLFEGSLLVMLILQKREKRASGDKTETSGVA